MPGEEKRPQFKQMERCNERGKKTKGKAGWEVVREGKKKRHHQAIGGGWSVHLSEAEGIHPFKVG